MKKMSRYIFLILYYCFAQFLPDSYLGLIGRLSNKIRIFCAKHLFAKCGKISTINRRAYFGSGKFIEIGDYSGIGKFCNIPNNTVIGNYVMMGPYVYILDRNHQFKDISKPMCFQGNNEIKKTIIEDDVWIGAFVRMTPGRIIKRGSIIGISTVLTKDFPPYSIIGGNPGKLIKNRG